MDPKLDECKVIFQLTFLDSMSHEKICSDQNIEIETESEKKLILPSGESKPGLSGGDIGLYSIDDPYEN